MIIENKKHEDLVQQIKELTQHNSDLKRLIAILKNAISDDDQERIDEFLTICASCKKIRKGHEWTQIESYIRSHFNTEFSHGICPECAKELYPNLMIAESGTR